MYISIVLFPRIYEYNLKQTRLIDMTDILYIAQLIKSYIYIYI